MSNIITEWDRRATARENLRDRNNTLRPPITRGKHVEQVDWASLKIQPVHVLTDSYGNFYFLAGMSTVGGPDIVRP